VNLDWKIEITDSARRQLAKLDKATAKQITAFLNERVAQQSHPRMIGKALTGPLGHYWRYRVGDYRIICDIQDSVLRVLVIQVGHRREKYR
jgi:mRNA interferase RelE/StbE